jgi:hypothetical protein
LTIDLHQDGSGPLRVNFENVVKQGLLCTKGKILGLYNNEGMFYLEKSRQIMTETGNERVDGPYIKYGPKKKSIQFSLDLTPYNPKMPLTILKVAGSKNKFQIFEGEQLKIKLKASGEKEREEWINCI